MEKLNVKYATLSKAIESFKRAIDDINIAKQEHKPYGSIPYNDLIQALRDSLIQRFEYSVDLSWKYLKDYLEIIHKVVPEVRSPKNIIRESAKLGILSEEEAQTAIDMIESRNLTSHIYREEIAEMIYASIPQYRDFFELLLTQVKPG